MSGMSRTRSGDLGMYRLFLVFFGVFRLSSLYIRSRLRPEVDGRTYVYIWEPQYAVLLYHTSISYPMTGQ